MRLPLVCTFIMIALFPRPVLSPCSVLPSCPRIHRALISTCLHGTHASCMHDTHDKMHVCICMYTCMHVYIYVCMYDTHASCMHDTHVCTDMHTSCMYHACMVLILAFIHVCMICMHHICMTRVSTYMHTCIHV